MKKFNFKLQGVLSIKEKLEGQAKVEFGLCMARLNEEEARRDEVISRINSYEDMLRELVVGEIDLKKISACRDAIDILGEELKECELAVKRAAKQVELARAKLTSIMTERKTISRLKEKSFENYLEEMKAEERKEIDELVSYRHSLQPEEETHP